MKHEYGSQIFPRLKESVRFRREDFGVICMDRITGKTFMLHPSEAVTVALCNGKSTLKEIIEIVRYAFSVDESKAQNHVRATLNKVDELVEYYSTSKSMMLPIDPIEFAYNSNQIPADKLPTYSGPLVMVLTVTERCNLKCAYCYKGKPRSEGPELTTREILRLINQAADLGVIRCFVTGGDPTMRPDLSKIVSSLLKADIFPFVSTKGYNMTDKLARNLAETGLENIQVSLDSCYPNITDKITGVKGSFQATINAIKILKQKDFKVRVKAVVTVLNVNTIHEMIDFCYNLGVDELSFSPFFPGTFGYGDKELLSSRLQIEKASKLIAEKTREYNGQMNVEKLTLYPNWRKGHIDLCGGMVTSMAVSSVGEIHLCELLTGFKDMIIGNVREMSLKEAWESQKAESWRDFDISKVSELCRRCELVKTCRTGCYNFSKVCYGDYYAPDPRCPKAPTLQGEFPFMQKSCGKRNKTANALDVNDTKL